MPSKVSPATQPVALVTGGAQRIGAAITRGLHGCGCNVVVHYHQSTGAAGKLADELNGLRADSALAAQANLLDDAAPAALVETAIARWGRLDVLVNNASSFYPTPLGSITGDDWQDLFGSNIRAPLFLAQAAAPHLTANTGCIINMIDIHAERPMRGHSVYSAAKAALASLTRSLARELAPSVRVNGIAPGAILWPEQPPSEQTRESILQRIALQRCGEPQDIVRAVRFLVFDAPYITGHILPVDGGRSLYM